MLSSRGTARCSVSIVRSGTGREVYSSQFRLSRDFGINRRRRNKAEQIVFRRRLKMLDLQYRNAEHFHLCHADMALLRLVPQIGVFRRQVRKHAPFNRPNLFRRPIRRVRFVLTILKQNVRQVRKLRLADQMQVKIVILRREKFLVVTHARFDQNDVHIRL